DEAKPKGRIAQDVEEYEMFIRKVVEDGEEGGQQHDRQQKSQQAHDQGFRGELGDQLGLFGPQYFAHSYCSRPSQGTGGREIYKIYTGDQQRYQRDGAEDIDLGDAAYGFD